MSQIDRSIQADPIRHKHRKCFGLTLRDILSYMASLVVPMMLGGFTVFVTVQQQQIAREERVQDRIESLEKHQRELQSAKEDRDNQVNITTERHRDNVLVAYIKDMGDMLEKNEYSLTHHTKIAALARAKTLSTMRQLDGSRNSQVLRFLYESMLLTINNESKPMDISTAILANIEKSTLNTVDSIGTMSLAGIILENSTFIDILLKNVNLTGAALKMIDFSSSSTDYSFHGWVHFEVRREPISRLIDIQFTSTTLERMDFLYTKLDNVNFTASNLIDVRFTNGRLQNITFCFSTLTNVDFSFTELFNLNFSSTTLRNVNFSFAILYHVQFSHSKMTNVNFASAILYNVSFEYASAERVQFVSSVLIDVNFREAAFPGSTFFRARRMKVLFERTKLNDASFLAANMKDAIFREELFVERANFSGANLQSANFSQAWALPEQDQLKSALSIHNILTYGKPLENTDLINDGSKVCNRSFLIDWNVHTERVSVLSATGNALECRLLLRGNQNEANISKRIILSNIWNPDLWPSTYAYFKANISDGISLELIGVDRKGTPVEKHIINEASHARVRGFIKLSKQMHELVVQINFRRGPIIKNGTNEVWCSGMELFLDYGTEAENRVVPHLPFNARWDSKGVTVLQGLNQPYGLTIDQEDNTIFVADFENHRIVATMPGNIDGYVVAGGHGQGSALHQLNHPTDVLIDKETYSVIICDSGNRRVMRWCLGKGTTQGEIFIDGLQCYGLAIDNKGTLYVTDQENSQLRRYTRWDMSGTILTMTNDASDAPIVLHLPTFVAVDDDGIVYVSDFQNNRIVKWSEETKHGAIVTGDGKIEDNSARQFFPAGLVVDNTENVYVVNLGKPLIARWKKGSNRSEIVLRANGDGHQFNQLNGLVDLSFDNLGNLFVCDLSNNRILRFSTV